MNYGKAYFKSYYDGDKGSSFVRASNLMCTQSESVYEWSIKHFGPNERLLLGIASKIEPGEKCYMDESAILYDTANRRFRSKSKFSNEKQIQRIIFKTGDVIRFKFIPQRKKLIIDMVKNSNF